MSSINWNVLTYFKNIVKTWTNIPNVLQCCTSMKCGENFVVFNVMSGLCLLNILSRSFALHRQHDSSVFRGQFSPQQCSAWTSGTLTFDSVLCFFVFLFSMMGSEFCFHFSWLSKLSYEFFEKFISSLSSDHAHSQRFICCLTLFSLSLSLSAYHVDAFEGHVWMRCCRCLWWNFGNDLFSWFSAWSCSKYFWKY